MQTLYDVGQTVLVPMKVTKIDINASSEITYKLEASVLSVSRKETDLMFFADESFIHSGLISDDNETVIPDESVDDAEEAVSQLMSLYNKHFD